MKRFNSISKFYVLLLLLALSTLGVAYGQWTDQLNVNGTVQTGSVDANFSTYRCSDDELLATINAAFNPADTDILDVTISNSYPGYQGYCSVNYLIGGTIPVYLKSIDFNPGSNLTNCNTVHQPGTGSFTANCDQLTIIWSNGLGTCFNIGGSEGSNMDITVLAGSEPTTTYGYTVQYTFEQGCP